MNERVHERLAQLRQEYEKGQQMLDSLRQQQAELEQTLLRISGAMQVLEELLAQADPSGEPSGGPAAS